jgi:Pup amidohydrolase
LHCIFYDSTMADTTTYLKAGALQMVVAMLEAGCVKSNWILEDPVAAARLFSHDVSLAARAKAFGDRRTSALELQYGFLEQAGRFVACGLADGIVPDAGKILEAWSSTLDLLRAKDFAKLTRRLDWVLKLAFIERAMRKRNLPWASPEVKALDHMYANLDESEGLFLAAERRGLVERIADPARTEQLLESPPEDTRAYTRGRLLALADPLEIDSVDWDHIEFVLFDRQRFMFAQRRVDLSNPLKWGKRHTGDAFQDASTVSEVIERIRRLQPDSQSIREEKKYEPTYQVQ